jgi:HEPN domain-containing protein
VRADTQNWIASAEYDLETASHMLATGRYLYVVFCCHIALEKILKAHVTEVTQAVPPKTHDLLYLIKKAGIQMPPAYLTFVGLLNNASVPTRYPDDLQKMMRDYTAQVAQDYLQQTTEVLEWLKQHPNLGT